MIAEQDNYSVIRNRVRIGSIPVGILERIQDFTQLDIDERYTGHVAVYKVSG